MKNKIIADIGCGNGKETILLSHYFPSSLIIGVDIAKNSIRTAVWKRKPANCEFILADFQFLPFRERVVNAAYSADVFEHIPNLPKAISELSRVLKESGRVAVYSATSGLDCMRRKVLMFLGFDPWVQLDGHISLYSFKELVNMLEKHELQLNRYYFYPDTYGIILCDYDQRLEEKFPKLQRIFRYRFLYWRFIRIIFSTPIVKYVLHILHASFLYMLLLLTRNDKGGVFLRLHKVTLVAHAKNRM